VSNETVVASAPVHRLVGLRPYYDEAGITIYHGDCAQVLPFLDPVDLLLTDPPYGIGADLGGGKSAKKWEAHTGENRWDASPIADWLMDLAISKANKAIIWGGNYYSFRPSPCWLFWDKETAGVTTFADGEMAWTNLDKAVRLIRHLWSGPYMRYKEVREHPTQKPLPVMRWCIEQAGDVSTILDPFMGSGTTLVAAKNLGKRAIGIERELKYCEIAVRRLAQQTLFQVEQSNAKDQPAGK
jgi:DNA modification methylase